ncbi:MAG: ABC transporter ATP-binding protein [Synergistales bacterium]|nr:ABC transporter ATP-binding protein [Synergistales bacterium]
MRQRSPRTPRSSQAEPTSTRTASIETESLTKRFGEATAVDGLTLSIRPGELFGLVGPDGAGKTTTLRLLTAIMRPDSGAARVGGFDTVRQPEEIKAIIGYMSQRFGLYSDLTVQENIDFYADLYDVPRGRERRERTERLLGFSNLTPFRNRRAGRLSGGMKQKLGLACALIHTPQLLFLDEPTNGVDPVSRRDFWRILYSLLREGVTIVVSTAYLDEAERCSRLALLDRGRLLAAGTPEEIKAESPGIVYEIRLPETRNAAHLLREHLPDTAVNLFGDRLHLQTADSGVTTETLRHALDEAGFTVSGIREIAPSLEDIFIVSLDREERNPS